MPWGCGPNDSEMNEAGVQHDALPAWIDSKQITHGIPFRTCPGLSSWAQRWVRR